MEKELNIAAILKDKPSAKLWSPIIGDCIYSNYYPSTEEIVVNFTNRYGEEGEWNFHQSGRTLSAQNTAEVCLFPSNSMRSWEKFAWKKGDVLKVATGSDCSCIFDRFTNDDYTEFTGVFDKYLDRFDSFATSDWCKVTDEKEYESIIQRIETQYGGKLNLDTLKIEKPQFKDGDIVFVEGTENYCDYIEIFSHFEDGDICDHASYDIEKSKLDCDGYYNIGKDEYQNIRPATDSEKQQLFDALAKENKTWDAEKKRIVDLPKKCEFKPMNPMDLCLMRDFGETWKLCQFGFMEEVYAKDNAPYNAVGGNWFNECIPYNDQTAHLLGTTDDWKGGEG